MTLSIMGLIAKLSTLLIDMHCVAFCIVMPSVILLDIVVLSAVAPP